MKEDFALKVIKTYPDGSQKVIQDHAQGVTNNESGEEIYRERDVDHENNIQHSFEINPKEFYDQLLVDLKGNGMKDLPPSEISEKINKGFGGMTIYAITPGDFEIDIFRVRKDDGNVIETEIDQFWHGPAKDEYGRVNLKNQRIFYGSITPHAALMETQSGPGEYYVTRWKLKFRDLGSQLVMFGFDGTEREGTSVISKAIKEGMQKHFCNIPEPHRSNLFYKISKYHEIFTSRGKEFYHLSATMANMFLSLRLNEVKNMFVITYPSVAKELNDVNFAIRQEFAEDEKYLSLQAAIKIKVKEFRDNDIVYETGRKAIVENGKLVWHSVLRKPIATKLGIVDIELEGGEVKTGVDANKAFLTTDKGRVKFSDFLQKDVLTLPKINSTLWSFSKGADYLEDNHLDYTFEWPLELDPKNPVDLQVDGVNYSITGVRIPVVYRDQFLKEID